MDFSSTVSWLQIPLTPLPNLKCDANRLYAQARRMNGGRRRFYAE
ncbi:hypothetical protein P9G49_14960 [Heyndrickxia coagulans]|nr:hypothetical protein [Heyndrickxia coagulans]